ncbi:hypothetical protein BJX66DRAFT_320548 [Aspergillus keveii]|uniref:Glycosyl transferase CAP10 domain-containing protein n=1 Tax=Aspergillus keveii TaxID=714993 RepID=A0ABR4FGZ2_9EURO
MSTSSATKMYIASHLAQAWLLKVKRYLQDIWGTIGGHYYDLNPPVTAATPKPRRWLIILKIVAAVCVFSLVLRISFPPAFILSNATDRGHLSDLCQHPIARLVESAWSTFNKTIAAQSDSLEEAVVEYRRRYSMPPPPQFDKWYQFAVERGTVLVDEFDTIHHSLLPFWSIPPRILRKRTRENLGDSTLMGITIRNGQVNHLGNGQGEFQAPATVDMISAFAKWLPDMDLVFNVHDEPRVVIPHDELAIMVAAGRESQTRLNSLSSWRADFSPTPPELELPIGSGFPTKFYDLGRQLTWQSSRMSCPIDSPARDLNDEASDNTTTYAMTPLGFVSNQTAFSDICLSPSLRHHLGLFNRPNVYKITNELCPIFSASKLSSFQDILYPSPWYYADKTVYDSNFAVEWEEQASQLYWRGSTTGGHSENGEWHDLLRQYVIAHIQTPEDVLILQESNDTCNNIDAAWEIKHESPAKYQDYFDTRFTRIDQCSPGDCADEAEFFRIANHDKQEEAWRYRYLLDMDGHAYSGRFYAFLRSKSLPMKIAYFREWHSDFLFPWVHYAPLSLKGKEYREMIRYFEHEGSETARRLASSGEEWAKHILTRDAFQVWMFRLLLEFGRVVDDNRGTLGYSDATGEIS